jgi:hypothetical protein
MPTKPVKNKKEMSKKGFTATQIQAPESVVASQKKKIIKRGGKVTFRRDGNLPVGLY